MDYHPSLIYFEEAKALISPRTGCLFIWMKYKQNRNEKQKGEEISTLTFLLNFSQDFEKNYDKRKNCENWHGFLA